MSSFEKNIGFIGSGNMARAIIRGMLSKNLVSEDQIWISDASSSQVAKVKEETGVNAAANNRDLARNADIIVLATKPHHVAGVMGEIRDELSAERNLVASICAGVRTKTIEDAANAGTRVIRVMPNTPALIGCGSAAIAPGKNCTASDLQMISQIFDSVGTSIVTTEEKLDAVTGVSGSGPAYVFRFIEALMAAARAEGLTEDEAQVLVPQMVLGAARMAVEDDRPLHELREAVTTPGGTTAAGLNTLDDGGFTDLISKCVNAATLRSRELG